MANKRKAFLRRLAEVERVTATGPQFGKQVNKLVGREVRSDWFGPKLRIALYMVIEE